MAIEGFVRAEGTGAAATASLDPSQQAVVDLPDDASAAILGAPGSGKSTTIVELVADRVLGRGWSPSELVVLTPTRASATRLRDILALRLGVATNGPLARTVNSLAFEIVGNAARAAGAEAPRLVTGGDQDVDFAALLDGHIAEGGGPAWPQELGADVRALRGFRTELRELMMRATEYGVSTDRLRQLGADGGRPEWVAAADFIDEYLEVISASRPSHLDAAEFARFAVAAIASGDAGERVEGLRLVIVDDLQEATESTIAILRAFASRGIAVIAFGDPDVAANAFRGGEPDALGRLGSVLLGGQSLSGGLSTAQSGRAGIRTLVLDRVHRQGPALRAFTSSITERIGTAAAGSQRRAVAAGRQENRPLAQVVTLTPGRQLAAIARELRERHLMHGVPWSELAVIVRSGAQTAAIRRALALAEVPARSSVGGTALRDDRAARALLTVVDVGIGRTALTPPLAVELLLGPFGGIDRLGLRRLRLALRAEELAGDGNRPSDELLVDALSAPGRFATIDHRIGRSADRLASILGELRARSLERATIEELLWHAWERSGLAEPWRDQALSAGIAAAEANANLDGILALFTAAKRFVERRPTDAAVLFLDAVLDADVPEDTLTPQPNDEAVLVTTPSGAVGLEFDTVVVTGLQDGAWPNRRLRGSLLGAQELVRVVTGLESASIDERKLVLDDELRIFALAVSRARREVVLAAVANDDEAASVFLSLVPPDAASIDAGSLPPLSLRGLTGRLRRELNGRVGRGDAGGAAGALARLAAERVPGADPAEWHGLVEPSTTDPLFLEEERVPVSPSQLQKFEDSPLDWFIESIAGGEPSTSMGLGTILHWAMETAGDPSVDTVWAAVESRWGELLFESDWMAETQKRAARTLAAGIAEYLADFQRDGKVLVGAESRFKLEIDRADVNGSIDRVERSGDGSVVIVDLKTGAPITSQERIDGHPQLGVYQLAYAQGVLDEFLDELGEHHSGGAKLLFVKKGIRSKLYREGIQPPLDDEQLEGFRMRIRQAAAGMALAEFQGVRDVTSWTGGTNPLAIHRVRAVSSD
ncbi:MAG TPA: ATP-dependent DNA helicase [Galbitalea sp.]|jgi:superfamily I DNA/RNA helicase/RecB family exonuclease